jgi:PAS domain S-box-containing protein
MHEKPTYEELEQKIRELESAGSEYKRLLKELQQKEIKYQNLFDNMLHEVHVWELVYDDFGNIKTWKLVDANPAALKSWGKDLSEIAGKTTDDIFPNSNATELFTPIVDKIFEEGTPYVWEEYFSGTNQYLHMISIPFGKYFISTGLDITDRRKVEESSLENAKKFQNFVSNLPGTAYQFVINEEGEFFFEYMGDNCIDIFGHEAADILENADLIFDLIPEPDAGIVNQAIQDSARTMTPYNVEHRIIKKNGETVWLHAISTPRKHNNGGILWDGIGLDITERKHYEMLLEKRNTDLRLAQRIASIGTWTLDPEVGVPEWSDEIYRIYERDPKLGPHPLADCKDIYKGLWWERFNKAIQGSIQDGTPYDIELRLELPSGNVKWVHAICEPETELGPKGRKLRGTIQDITERKRFEESLRQKHEMLIRTEAIAHIGSWEWEIESDTVTWSEELYRIFQLDPDGEAPNWENHPKLYHPEDFEKLRQAAETAIADGKPYELELRAFRKDGETRFCKAIGVPESGKSGQVVRLFGLLQDITDKKRYEDEMRKGESFLRTLLDAIPIPVFYKGTDGRYLGFNKSFEVFFGKDEDDLLGKSVFDINPPDLAKIYFTKDQELLEAGGTQQYETQVQNASGDRRDVIFNKAVFRDPDGKVGGLIGAILDITERKQSEEALRESEDFLNRTGDMAQVGGWEVDLNTMKVVWTRTTGRIHELPHGYFPDLEEAISYYHPEDQDHVRQCVQRAIESAEPFDFTVRLITAKGVSVGSVRLVSRSSILAAASGFQALSRTSLNA